MHSERPKIIPLVGWMYVVLAIIAIGLGIASLGMKTVIDDPEIREAIDNMGQTSSAGLDSQLLASAWISVVSGAILLYVSIQFLRHRWWSLVATEIATWLFILQNVAFGWFALRAVQGMGVSMEESISPDTLKLMGWMFFLLFAVLFNIPIAAILLALRKPPVRALYRRSGPPPVPLALFFG